VASFGWAGSALVGGVVSDTHGYSFAFAITATMQLVGVWMQAPLVYLVAKEEGAKPEAAASRRSSSASEDDLGLERA